ncbi:MAG: anaerobic ribonucleoside-triphosphate reductase activating protein [Deltaproteobacteria bacterium]|jgi:anaerobic ribonucleoside-triphosphate reductase activating protein|nr:anaerobic ribonucleoside-triphosphate reductase activating protein [Deltaproteobacteria bacterium]
MFKDNLRIIKIFPETIVDGAGLRYSIYLAGCAHRCPGCHNPESWNPNHGMPLTREWLNKIIQNIRSNPMLDGVTFSGGDPFFYPQSLIELLKIIKIETKQNIWCYTGWTLEELLAAPERRACLQYIDTLVDGRFLLDKLSHNLKFCGSSNQRIIHLGQLDLTQPGQPVTLNRLSL